MGIKEKCRGTSRFPAFLHSNNNSGSLTFPGQLLIFTEKLSTATHSYFAVEERGMTSTEKSGSPESDCSGTGAV